MAVSTDTAGRDAPSESLSVVMLSQFMFPEANATGELLTSLACGLVQKGFVVKAYAAQPTYFASRTVASSLTYHGVSIRRLWSTQFGRRSMLARAIDGATFMVRLLLELPRFPKDASVLAVTNPPFLPVIGGIRKLASGRPFVLLVHDVYPEVALQLGVVRRGGLAHRLLAMVDKFILSQADAVIVLGRDMRDRVNTKIRPGRQNRIIVIPNWADAEQIRVMPKSASAVARREGLLNSFVIQYSGNLGLSQCFDVILAAARELLDLNLIFTFVGDGAQALALKDRVQNGGLRNVRFLPRADPSDLNDSLAACDLAIVPLLPGVEGLSVPSKYYGILASGRPVIAVMSSQGEVARSVIENRCGLVVSPDDPAALVRALRILESDRERVSQLGLNARIAFERFYTREQALAAYQAVLTSVQRPTRRALTVAR